jgi:hypothetical protein
MNRSTWTRVAAIAASVMAVASCDTRTIGVTQPGSSTSSSKTGAKGPSIAIDSPTAGALVNIGDSVFVSVHLHDDRALSAAVISGVTQTGSVDLGTFKQKSRYATMTVPISGTFRAGLRDTTIRRFLQPLSPLDTTLDSLVVLVTARDSLGVADTSQVAVQMVAGPKVTIEAPSNGDSIPAGVGLSISARAQHGDGIARIDIRAQGDANWPTKLDTTISQVYQTSPRDITFTGVIRVPADAPIRGRIIVTATSVDMDREPGSAAPVAVYVRGSSASAQPRVTQIVQPKSEYTDSVSVSATGDGIALVGLILRDSAGTIVQQDSVRLPPPYNANVQTNVPLNLAATFQGKKLGVTAFAVDQGGRVGYAVKSTTLVAQGNLANALIDSTLVVYGRTYPLPHNGVVGDVAVDPAHGHVFLSATDYNLLDVWQTSVTGKGFAPASVPVGSLPWGLSVSNNTDTLLVANSGGTNISRVFIGSNDASGLHEDLAHRILTRNTYVYVVHWTPSTSGAGSKITIEGPFSYSDRPQYIAQSAGGRIFYSTRPTATATAGTIRWLDPSLPVPDPRQIWQYGTIVNTQEIFWAVFNVDSMKVGVADPTSGLSDSLYIWDHPYGQKTGVITAANTNPQSAIADLVAQGSDAEAVLRLDVSTLPLQDTTFAAASGNRHWVAFGEGHSSGAGRVVMVADSTGVAPNFFSPLVTISDFTDNASEPVFGLALDRSGGTVAAHGTQSYFGAVEDPFHLRLQGKYDSFDDGAGITFHPLADGTLTPQDKRLAFVAAASGQIEVVDIAYYSNRARLMLKHPIYGPIRASLPMPGDSPDVILKLFAVSKDGLIVIDLTSNDIKPGP